MLDATDTLAGRLAADRRGVTAIATAIALAVLFGFAGLAMDVASWLYATRGMQAAADLAAYSAAAAAGTSGCSSSTAPQQAAAIAAARGYVNNVGGATVTTTCNSGNSTYTVAISQTQPIWFTSLFMSQPPVASGSATAQVAGKVSDVCVLALDGTNIDEGVTGNDASAAWLNGNTTLNLHCGLAVDSGNLSSLAVGGSSNLTATDIYLVGDDQGSPSGSSTIVTSPTANNIFKNQPPIGDPYEGRTIPSLSGCDHTNFAQTANGTLNPGVYCAGLTLGGSQSNTVSLNSGVYYVVGGSLTINSKATVSGSGVTFVLTGNKLGQTGYATITINAGASVSLAAPTSGTMGGLLFFQDRNAPFSGSASSTSSCGNGNSQNQINGGSSQLLTGAVYFPSQSLCYTGSSSTSGAGQCTQIIARSVSFSGSSDVKLSCTGTGINPIAVPTPQLIK